MSFAILDNGNASHEKRRRSSQDLINSKYYEAIVNGPEDMDRRLRNTDSFKSFCEDYGPQAFTLAWSPYHLEAIEKIEEVIKNGACYGLAMPRGSGKSTLCHWAVIWGLFCGHVEYAMYVGATSGSSTTRLQSIKTTLRFSDELYADFPEIIGPIRFCEGEARKAGGQKFDGTSTEIRWGSDKLIFGTLQNLDQHAKWYKDVPFNQGGILDFASMEASLRGRSVELPDGRIIRPQVAVVDDPQTRESAASPAQVLKREHILKGDIGYLGGPERQCGVVVPCTVVYEDDLAHRLLDHELNPEFRGTRSAMLPQFPGHGLPEEEAEEIMQMWEVDYDEKRRYDLLHGTSHATEYYRTHRERMDRGGFASWPLRFSVSKNEISAIQSAMNLYLADEMSFMCEAQNEPMPLEASDQIPLTIQDILDKGINLKRNTCPTNTDFLTAFIDVSRNVLWYTVVAWDKNTFKGHIVNYGVFPDQKKPYVTLASAKKTIPDIYKTVEYSVGLTRAIDDLAGLILSQEYITEAGMPVYVERVGIDSGWGEEAQTVYQYCRRSKVSNILIATKGFGSTPLKRPLVDPEKKREPNSNLVGQWKFSRNSVGSRLLSYDVNLWKSKVASMLRLPAEASSGITMFNAKEGKRTVNHRMIAEQLTAEKPITVSAEGSGRKIEMWKKTGSLDEHLWDCLVGSTMLAHVAGCNMQIKDTKLQARIGGNQSKRVRKKRRRFVQGD